MPSTLISVLAVIGGVVVTAIAVAFAWFGLGVVLIYIEKGFKRISGWMFQHGGGVASHDSDETVHPDPPWDRLWIEFNWLASVMRLLQTKLGYASYVDPGARPDIERLYELREESQEATSDGA